MPAAAAGKWSLALGVEIAANDRVELVAPILIEKYARLRSPSTAFVRKADFGGQGATDSRGKLFAP
jgi:hypothetical protein